MSRLLDDDQELESQQRELTLSTGAILAIFLGLVLLCAVFFGFGYNLGRKSTTAATGPAVPAASDTAPPATAAGNSTFDNFKPSPVSSSSSVPPPASTSTAASNTTTVETTPAPVTTRTTPATSRPSPPAPASATPPPATHPPPAAAPATTPTGSFIVQIAAISSSHKDDADLLVNALHNKGYDVAEHTTDQDKLIHIQVGPFATKADAEAMRERLIVDGYNAIVK
jgi:cell division septation protein DedD